MESSCSPAISAELATQDVPVSENLPTEVLYRRAQRRTEAPSVAAMLPGWPTRTP